MQWRRCTVQLLAPECSTNSAARCAALPLRATYGRNRSARTNRRPAGCPGPESPTERRELYFRFEISGTYWLISNGLGFTWLSWRQPWLYMRCSTYLIVLSASGLLFTGSYSEGASGSPARNALSAGSSCQTFLWKYVCAAAC